MRKLLIGTVAAITAAVSGAYAQQQVVPPASALTRPDQIYLVLVGRAGESIATIPVRDMNQCEEQGAKWVSSKRLIPHGSDKSGRSRTYFTFECFEGVQ